MLKKILVPLDGSALAEKAIGFAAELSIPTGASMLLVRVATSHTMPGVDARERKEGAIYEAERYLTETAAKLIERGYGCEAVVPYGHAAECIADQARMHNSSLIVMSTHGRTGPGRLLFGSVAEQVVARSTVPVFVTRAWLPTDPTPFLPDRPMFVVPLDGSTFAESAVEPAVLLADDIGGVLLLVRAEPDAARVSEALEYLTQMESTLQARYPDLNFIIDVRTGDPARAIDTALRENGASTVVMATHGRSGLQRSVIGSVAGRVLRESTAPVVLIRPPAHLEAYPDQERELVGARMTTR